MLNIFIHEELQGFGQVEIFLDFHVANGEILVGVSIPHAIDPTEPLSLGVLSVHAARCIHHLYLCLYMFEAFPSYGERRGLGC